MGGPMRGAAVLVLVGLLGATMASGFAWAGLEAAQQNDPSEHKVNICHATGNGKYTSNSEDIDSIVKGEGHGGHPEDIIPSFDYEKGNESGHYPGRNWDDEGQAIWNNGCVTPDPPDPPDPPDCTGSSVTTTDSGGASKSDF